MAIKAIIAKPSNYQPLILYTVPAGKKAVLRNLLACTEILNNYFTNKVNLRLSTGQTISSDVSVVMGSKTPSLLSEPIQLSEGEYIEASVSVQWATKIIEGQRLPANIEALSVNDAGTVWIASCGPNYGLYRSDDQGLTWTSVYVTKPKVAAFVYFKNTFFFYMADGTTLKSVDQGLNFTSHTYADTPTSTEWGNNLHGRILKKDANTIVGVYGISGDRLITSTDGINWVITGSGIPNQPTSKIQNLGWTGTNYVLTTNIPSHGVLYSPTASGWATGSLNGSTNSLILIGTSAGGTVLVVANGGALNVSNDHGVNFVAKYSPGSIQGTFVWTGSYFFGGFLNGIVKYINPLSCEQLCTSGGHYSSAACSIALSDKIIGVQTNMVWQTYNLDPLNEQRYGMSLHLSVIEEDV